MFLNIKKYILVFLACFLFINIHNIKADDNDDQKTALKALINAIFSKLGDMNCSATDVGSLLFNENTHTCTSEDLASITIAGLISPIFKNSMLKMRINEDDLYANGKPLSDQCKPQNRVSYYAQKISFGICNDLPLRLLYLAELEEEEILAAQITIRIIQSGMDIFSGLSTGDMRIWKIVADVLRVDPALYTTIYENAQVGDVKYSIDIPPLVVWIRDSKDKICATVPTFLGSFTPVGCIYVQEPYPNSIYRNFFGDPLITQECDPSSCNNTKACKCDANTKECDSTEIDQTTDLVQCSNMHACYIDAKANSRTLMPISSPLISCVKNMLTKLFISSTVCDAIDKTKIGKESTLYKFQQSMTRAVTAFLTIYIILFGFRILLQGNIPRSSDFILMVLKFVLVVYFSIGLNDSSSQGQKKFSGMIDWAFPIMFKGADTMAGWIINADPSGLCDFSTINSGNANYDSIRLWDSLDCRIANYLGLNALLDFGTELVQSGKANIQGNWNNPFALSFSFPPYMILFGVAIYTGNILLAMVSLAYPLLVISVAAYMVNAFIVSMISITILGILSPIFVPMALFNYTKGYFEGWLKLMISFVLQPMIVATFMVMMFLIYDSTFFDSCKYDTKFVSAQDGSFSDNDKGNISRIFFVIADESSPKYKGDEFKKCSKSLGYILNNPFVSLYSGGASIVDRVKNAFSPDASNTSNANAKLANKYSKDFTNNISQKPSTFFDFSLGLIPDGIKDFLLSMITCILVLTLMYNFSEQLSEFAAAVTGGISVAGATINPQTTFKVGMQAIQQLGNISQGLKSLGSGSGAESSRDSFSSSGGTNDSIDSVSSSQGEQNASGSTNNNQLTNSNLLSSPDAQKKDDQKLQQNEETKSESSLKSEKQSTEHRTELVTSDIKEDKRSNNE